MAVKLNKEQINKVAGVFKSLPDGGNGLNFYSYINSNGTEIWDSEKYPTLNHLQAINFFFFTVMHDYGFWYGGDRGYIEPLYGVYGRRLTKGSDLLFKVVNHMLAYEEDGRQFAPARLAEIKPKELVRIFRDDYGPIPFPDFETRFKITRAYGRWFCSENISPQILVSMANQGTEPLKYFLTLTRLIPGYDSDWLLKKNLLLAMVLTNRPEKFLEVKDAYNWKPLIDYHLMRLSLRLGLVELDEKEWRINSKREWVSRSAHQEIRSFVFDAVDEVIKESGRLMPFIDEKMWMARKYCPEMEIPNCLKCVFDKVCKKRVELFQPVYRTIAY